MTLPRTTPADLAADLGVSERRIRTMARRLGACRVFGKTMVLLPQDVEAILEAFKAPPSSERQTIQKQAARIAELEERERERHRKQYEAQQGPGFVYFIRCGDLVKIGFAKDVAKRVRALQTGAPQRLELVLSFKGTLDDEAKRHRQFRNLRVDGEWFRFEGKLKAFVDGGGG